MIVQLAKFGDEYIVVIAFDDIIWSFCSKHGSCVMHSGCIRNQYSKKNGHTLYKSNIIFQTNLSIFSVSICIKMPTREISELLFNNIGKLKTNKEKVLISIRLNKLINKFL